MESTKPNGVVQSTLSGDPSTDRQATGEGEVMLSVESAELDADLGSELFVLEQERSSETWSGAQMWAIPAVLELGVAGDQFGLAIGDLGLGTPVSCPGGTRTGCVVPRRRRV
ncbi:MAG: hypothetical protein R2710_30025 [Acidimicrobiales bacterium]